MCLKSSCSISRKETESTAPKYRLKIKDESGGVVRYSAKDEVKRAAAADSIEVGEQIWVAMDTDEVTLERDDGSTHDYNPTMVAFPGGD